MNDMITMGEYMDGLHVVMLARLLGITHNAPIMQLSTCVMSLKDPDANFNFLSYSPISLFSNFKAGRSEVNAETLNKIMNGNRLCFIACLDPTVEEDVKEVNDAVINTVQWIADNRNNSVHKDSKVFVWSDLTTSQMSAISSVVASDYVKNNCPEQYKTWQTFNFRDISTVTSLIDVSRVKKPYFEAMRTDTLLEECAFKAALLRTFLENLSSGVK